MLCEHL